MNFGTIIFLGIIAMIGYQIYNAYKESEKKRKEQEKKQAVQAKNVPAPSAKSGGYFNLADEIRRQKEKEQKAMAIKNNKSSNANLEPVVRDEDRTKLQSNLTSSSSLRTIEKPAKLHAFTESSMGDYQNPGSDESYERLVSKRASVIFEEEENDNLKLIKMMVMGDVLNNPKFKK